MKRTVKMKRTVLSKRLSKEIIKQTTLFSIFTSLSIIPVIGQDSCKVQKIDEVTVTTNRYKKLLDKTPDVVMVICSEDIKRLNATSTGEILEYVTGLSINKGTGSATPNRSSVTMNGYPANYGLILVDGKRVLSDHIHTGQNVDMIAPENIQRIEVIKGAASSQYGSDAMAGVINIITKKAGDEPSVSLFTSFGTFNETTGGIAIRTPLGDGVKAATFVKWEESDGTEILAPTNRAGYMDYTKLSIMNSVSKTFADSSELLIQNILINGTNTWNKAEVSNRLFIPSIEYTTKVADFLTISPKVYYSRWTAEVNTEKNELFQPELLLSFTKIKNNHITFGGEYKYMTFERVKVEKNEQNAQGVFLQDEISFNKFIVLPAIRFDKYDNIDGVFSPKLSMMYNQSANFRIRASVGRGFRAPSLMDMYEQGYGHSGRAYRFGNPDLLPEYNMSSTIGFETKFFNRVELFVYGYYSQIENMISPIYQGAWPENPTVDMWVRTNIAKAEIIGGEAFAKYRITNNFNLDAGLTVTENKNLSNNQPLPYHPGRAFFSRFNFNKDLTKSINCNLFVSYKTEADRSAWSWKPGKGAAIDDLNGMITPLAQYDMLNAGVNVTFDKKYSIYFNVNNILEQDIELLDDAFYVSKGQLWMKGGMVFNL